MLNNFNIEGNFWEYNPQLKIAFRDFYEADESKNKKESTKMMWAISLLHHPESKFRSVDEEYRKKLIEDDFLKINEESKGKKGRPKRFDWSEYDELITQYKTLCLTKAQRFLMAWEKKLDERMDLMAEFPYDKENFEWQDKMIKETDKMWKTYMTCLKDVENEDNLGSTRGGAVESLKDQGDI